jgi:hypothetical protein
MAYFIKPGHAALGTQGGGGGAVAFDAQVAIANCLVLLVLPGLLDHRGRAGMRGEGRGLEDERTRGGET